MESNGIQFPFGCAPFTMSSRIAPSVQQVQSIPSKLANRAWLSQQKEDFHSLQNSVLNLFRPPEGVFKKYLSLHSKLCISKGLVCELPLAINLDTGKEWVLPQRIASYLSPNESKRDSIVQKGDK